MPFTESYDYVVTAPTTGANGVGTPTGTAPGDYLITGSPAPVNTAISVAPPTVVAHSATLANGINYLVQVGTRSAPVTITLPTEPTTGQRVEVVDASGQATTQNITVTAGATTIETAGQTTYVIRRNNAVLALYYTGAKWKLL